MDNENFNTEGGTIIVSVVENRAREICICKFDTTNVSAIASALIAVFHVSGIVIWRDAPMRNMARNIIMRNMTL